MELGCKFLKEGLNSETLRMSEELDVSIVMKQREMLEEYKKNKRCKNE